MSKDPFKEPWNARRIAGITGMAVLLAALLAILCNPVISPSRKIFGVVQSSGPIAVASIHGGTREAASIRLTDGHVVLAYVTYGGPLSSGDSVTLLERARMLGPATYEVIAKR